MIGIIWAFVGAIFGAGGSYATMKWKVEKNQADIAKTAEKNQIDITRVAQIARDNDKKAERRWKHSIATAIETSATLEEAKIHAKLLREDAWRD